MPALDILNREALDRCSLLIDQSFPWADTREGHPYWENVCHRLNAYSAAGTTAHIIYVPPAHHAIAPNLEAEPRALFHAADCLTRAFCWGDSEEGDWYWRNVYSALLWYGRIFETPTTNQRRRVEPFSTGPPLPFPPDRRKP